MMEEELMIPTDLRSVRKVGKPSNQERATGSAIKEQIHILAADLLLDLRKQVKYMETGEKINLLGKLLAYVSDDKSQSLEDASFEVLAEKYLKIEMRVKGSLPSSTTTKEGAVTKIRKVAKGKQ